MESKLTFNKYPFLSDLGLSPSNLGCYHSGQWHGSGSVHSSLNPATNEPIAMVKTASKQEYEACVNAMQGEKTRWMKTPMPVRGEIIRQLGQEMRAKKEQLGMLISLEMGKIKSEGLGEVQEYIDVCDMATGMSRTIEGKVLPSERPGHFMMEVWNPLGLIGCITAFNFPVAVSGWNAAIALICGDLMLWKPALSTSLCAIAVQKIVAGVLERHGFGSVQVLCAGKGSEVGDVIVQDKRLTLISFTGSTSIGERIAKTVHGRFGRTILELGGNNAAVIMPDADLDLALKACVFACIGTAGQRCTSLRRVFLHESIHDAFLSRMLSAYSTIRLGDPLQEGVILGPLHTKDAVKDFEKGVEDIRKQGGKVLCGGKRVQREGNFVEPTIVSINHEADIVKEELFAPVVYVMKFKTLEEAIQWNNEVP